MTRPCRPCSHEDDAPLADDASIEWRDKVFAKAPALMEADGITSDFDEIAVHIMAEQTGRIANPGAGPGVTP